MNKDERLKNLKNKVGIDDFTSVSNDKFKTIQSLVGEGKISKDEMKLLIEAMPNFVQLQQTYVDGLKTVINGAKETQKDALRGISITLENITEILITLAKDAESDELRSKIADIALKLADYGKEIAKILQETNKDNNNTWKQIAGFASIAFITTVSVFVAMQNKNKKS
jgi:polyhydroxyalkanoate synthesis regulator phasin